MSRSTAYGASAALLLPLQLFLAAGWLRAGVEKVVDDPALVLAFVPMVVAVTTLAIATSSGSLEDLARWCLPGLQRSTGLVRRHVVRSEEVHRAASLQHRPDTALMVNDVQNDVVGNAYERDEVVATIGTLVDRARSSSVPVIWVQHADDELVADTDGWQIVPELAPGESEPIVRRQRLRSIPRTHVDRPRRPLTAWGRVGGDRSVDVGSGHDRPTARRLPCCVARPPQDRRRACRRNRAARVLGDLLPELR